MEITTNKTAEVLIKTSPAEIAKQRAEAGANTLTEEESGRLAEIKQKQAELKAMEDQFKADITESRKFYKVCEKEFYGGNRKLKLQVVEFDEEGNEAVEYEGEVPLVNPTTANEVGIQTETAGYVRGAHLQLENRNCSIVEQDGIAVNLDVTLRIGKKELVEYRKGSLQKTKKEFVDEESIKKYASFLKSSRDLHKQACRDKADKLQSLEKATPKLKTKGEIAILDEFADKITTKKKK